MIPDSGIPSTEVGFGQESTPSPTHGIEYMHYDSGIPGNECRCMNDGSTTLPCGIHATEDAQLPGPCGIHATKAKQLRPATYHVTRLAYQDGVRFCRYSTCRRMDRHRGSNGSQASPDQPIKSDPPMTDNLLVKRNMTLDERSAYYVCVAYATHDGPGDCPIG